jgi:CheY-like chemotaxis protein
MAKVLIVDDSAFQRKILTNTLYGLGHEVIASQNGKEGVEKAGSDRPDIMIIDLLMPEFDGFWVLSEMKERRIGIPVIVLTSDVQKTTMDRCFEMGAAAFLNKPPKPDELQAAIRNGLAAEKR